MAKKSSDYWHKRAVELAKSVEAVRGTEQHAPMLKSLYAIIRRLPQVRKQCVEGRPILECELGVLEVTAAAKRGIRVDRVTVNDIEKLNREFRRRALKRHLELLSK